MAKVNTAGVGCTGDTGLVELLLAAHHHLTLLLALLRGSFFTVRGSRQALLRLSNVTCVIGVQSGTLCFCHVDGGW